MATKHTTPVTLQHTVLRVLPWLVTLLWCGVMAATVVASRDEGVILSLLLALPFCLVMIHGATRMIAFPERFATKTRLPQTIRRMGVIAVVANVLLLLVIVLFVFVL